MNGRCAVALLCISVFAPAVMAAQGNGKSGGNAPHAAAPKAPNARGPAREGNARNAARKQPDNHPGERALERLQQMTPEERKKALENLPPQRRQEIEQKLESFRNMPPAERMRLRGQLERLNSLPPQRQNQVRRSIRQLQDLPDDRKALVKRELDRMEAMPDEERRSYMNTEEFRNRYTPTEQQMMQNLSEVLPENRDNRD